MGAFEDAIAGLDDLEGLASATFDDVLPDDIIQATDADGDALIVAYFVRSLADIDAGSMAGFYLNTTEPGIALSIEAAEALVEFLEDRIARAQEAGIA